MLLTNKYAPKKLEEIEGNDEILTRVRQWLLNWLAGKAGRALFLWGPAGTGKTATAYAIANEYDLTIIEMNSSELRDGKRVARILQGATLAGSLSGRQKLLLVDDIDSIQARHDFGGGAAIVALLKECSLPVIVTATNAWEKKLGNIRNECELLEMKRIGKIGVKRVLEQIIKAEKIEIDSEIIDLIVQDSNGDVRSAINDLQAQRSSMRDREKDIFQRIRKLFKASTVNEARAAVEGDVDLDLFKLWIDENIPIEYEEKEDIAQAFAWLSRADIFEGRIRKSYWKYLKYAIDLETAGVALAKQKVYRKFTKYMFPAYLRAMASSMQRRAMLKSIGTKIGAKVHTNRIEALHYLPLLKEISKNREQELALMYNLEEEELAFLIGTSPDKVRKKD